MSLALFFSIAALLVGPVVYSSARGRGAIAAVDAFALVAVAGLVFAHILPQSFQLAGWLVLPMAVLGLLGPGAPVRLAPLPRARIARGGHAARAARHRPPRHARRRSRSPLAPGAEKARASWRWRW
jgi:hypothetical protein